MERYKPLLKWFVIVSTSVTTSFITSTIYNKKYDTLKIVNCKMT